MKLNLKTKLAAWLVKCAEHLDPHSKLYSPYTNTIEAVHFPVQTKSIEQVCAQISYSHKFLDCATEQFEKDCVLPEIADRIADSLLAHGYIKVERIDNHRDIQWNAKLHVVQM